MEPLEDIRRRLDDIERKVAVGDVRLEGDLAAIRKDLAAIDARLGRSVSMDRYNPVERLVYGLVAVALVGIVSGLIARLVTG